MKWVTAGLHRMMIANGEYIENDEEDAEEMNELAGDPKDQENYDKLMEADLFEQDGKGV